MFVNMANFKYIFFSFSEKRQKQMKLFFYILLFLLFTNLNLYKAYSLTDYQIKKMCQGKKNKSTCFRKLKLKNLNLLQGNQIEIPVIPFKK